MRPKCPVCGKLFWCDYPNLWRYKRDKKYICSWSCLRKYDGKEAGDMAYRKIKKDGTPAKPTRKQKEEPKVELVYDPGIAEKYRREQAREAQQRANEQARAEAEKKEKDIVCKIDMEPLEVCGVRSRVLKDGVYTRNTAGNAMVLGGMSMRDDNIGLKAENWIRLSAEILLALEQCGKTVAQMTSASFKNFRKSVELLEVFHQEKFDKIHSREDRVDRFEDSLGSYLVQLHTRQLSEVETHTSAKYLSYLSNLERVSDYAVKLAELGQELASKKIAFSSRASKELHICTEAVQEV